jgi:hypothetical protein
VRVSGQALTIRAERFFNDAVGFISTKAWDPLKFSAPLSWPPVVKVFADNENAQGLDRTTSPLPGRQQRLEVPRTLRRTEPAQCLGFDLADALAREVELLADLAECVLARAADAEA